MSRSQKWRQEWALFLGPSGRRNYNKLCRSCIYDCKQSFRVTVIVCPRYQSKRTKNV